jgi:hypothetical protein
VKTENSSLFCLTQQDLTGYKSQKPTTKPVDKFGRIYLTELVESYDFQIISQKVKTMQDGEKVKTRKKQGIELMIIVHNIAAYKPLLAI